MDILSDLLYITQLVCETYSEDSIPGLLILRAWAVFYTHVRVCVCISSQRVFDVRSERESVMGS